MVSSLVPGREPHTVAVFKLGTVFTSRRILNSRRLAAPRLTDQIADRDSVLQAQRERRNRAADRVELGSHVREADLPELAQQPLGVLGVCFSSGDTSPELATVRRESA